MTEPMQDNSSPNASWAWPGSARSSSRCPRGGCPVGLEIALRLDAPLDVIGMRKPGAPGQPEFGIGAVAEDGVRVVDESATSMLGLDEADIERIAARERDELRRRVARYRGDRDLPESRRSYFVNPEMVR